MDHPEGAGLQRADRVDFDPRVRLEFRGTQLSSDGGLLVMRELDDALGLSDLASAALRDTRSGKNTVHGVCCRTVLNPTLSSFRPPVLPCE
jgi:hypothetical protein